MLKNKKYICIWIRFAIQYNTIQYNTIHNYYKQIQEINVETFFLAHFELALFVILVSFPMLSEVTVDSKTIPQLTT